MKKRNYSALIKEDTGIEKVIEHSVNGFDNQIKETIEEEFEKYLSGNSPLKTAMYDSVESGKHLRAFSTVLFYKLAGGKGDEFKKISAALELVHCASLIVDDEFDKRDTRPDRNSPSVRGKYSPEEAFGVALLNVLYSTHLLFEGTDHLPIEKKKQVRDIFVKFVTDAGIGEIVKWKFTEKKEIPSKKTYWKEFIGPTAALFFELTGKISAMVATDNQATANKIGKLAYKMGELLQAGDDLKDLKDDIHDGFYSLAVINYYEFLKEPTKKEFKQKLKLRLSEKAVNDIYYDVVYSESIKQTADDIKKKGEEILESLKEFPPSQERELLINMTKYLKDRMIITT